MGRGRGSDKTRGPMRSVVSSKEWATATLITTTVASTAMLHSLSPWCYRPSFDEDWTHSTQ